MMQRVIVIILHAFAIQTANSTAEVQDPMDKLTDHLVDKLFGRMMRLRGMSVGLPLGTAAQPMIPRRPFLSPFLAPSAGYQPQSQGMSTQALAVKDSLRMYGIGSSPLERLALNSLDQNNRGKGRLDVSMKAQRQIESGWSLEDDGVKRKLLKVLDQVKEKESVLAGITAPAGFWDPLGFATTGTSGGKLLFYREVELKHGRVAMLAALGMLVGEQYHPLFGGNIDVPSYIAFQQTPLQNFWPAVVAAIAIPEIFSVFTFQDPSKGEEWAMKVDHVPGDLGFDPLGLKPKDPKEFKTMQTKEINNGRLAMIAAAGMIAQEYATGQKLF